MDYHKTMYQLIVDQTGKGHYCTIQEALDAIPYAVEAIVIVREGIYREKLFSDKHDLTLSGEGTVVITGNYSALQKVDELSKRGTFRSYTAFFSGERLRLENLMFENTAKEGQSVALYLDVDQARLSDVRLYGRQDTLFLAPLPQKEREPNGFYGPRCFSPRKHNAVLLDNCYIQGGVDFIFGGADALFLNCRIVSSEAGFVTAPSTDECRTGFVFDHCSFGRFPSVADNSVYLMRPWREHGKGAYLHCSFGTHIHSDMKADWPGHEGLGEGTLRTYDCRFENGKPADGPYRIDEAQAACLRALVR